MRSLSLKTTLASLLVLGLFVGSSWASSGKTGKANTPPKTEIKSLSGTVEVTRDKAGKITAVDLKVGKVVKIKYNIALDDKGRELAEKMANKQVDVKGTIEKKSGVKWLTVKEYSEPAPKSAKKTTKD